MNFNNKDLVFLLRKFACLEKIITMNINEKLQLYYLISIFKKCGHVSD